MNEDRRIQPSRLLPDLCLTVRVYISHYLITNLIISTQTFKIFGRQGYQPRWFFHAFLHDQTQKGMQTTEGFSDSQNEFQACSFKAKDTNIVSHHSGLHISHLFVYLFIYFHRQTMNLSINMKKGAKTKHNNRKKETSTCSRWHSNHAKTPQRHFKIWHLRRENHN